MFEEISNEERFRQGAISMTCYCDLKIIHSSIPMIRPR
jgi:hypothetical protein